MQANPVTPPNGGMVMSRLAMARAAFDEQKRILLAEYPDLMDDEQALFDTVDGLTDLTDILAALCRRVKHELEIEIKAIKDLERQIKERRQRFEARKERLQKLILNTMITADIKKISRADIDFWHQMADQSVEVTIAPEMLPKKYQRVTIEVAADVAAIKRDLKAGKKITAKGDDGKKTPVAYLRDGTPFLRIKV